MESFSLFLFYSTLQPTREQHPTSTMTCDTSRSDDDDNNTTTTPSHVDTATRPGSLRVLFLGRTKLPSCVPCARETTPSVKPCRATLESGKPRASSATHKQQATRPSAQRAFVEPFRAHKGAVLLCARRQEELGICSGPRVSSLLSCPRGPPIFFVRSMQPASGYRCCKTEAH